MDEGGGGFVRQPDVHQVTTTKTGLMNTITTTYPRSRLLVLADQHSHHRWIKSVQAAFLTGLLCLVLIGVTGTLLALIGGGSTTGSSR